MPANPSIDNSRIITIERHILTEQRSHPEATGILTSILNDIALAGKVINSLTRRGGLAEILGVTDIINLHGDQVMKLDQLAHQTIYNLNSPTGRLAAMASEEQENILPLPETASHGKYVLLFDPLDGSSNIDFNAGIGTIFAIYRRKTTHGPGTIEDCLQKGRNLVAAGYILYSVSTMLVYTTGMGVHGFTLDPAVGEFLLTHPYIRLPEPPAYYSVNHSYEKYWSFGVQRFTKFVQGLEDQHLEKPLSLRYIGSLVADFHRNLLGGGVFYYPADSKRPRNGQGKLRLLYEAAPLAFIIEQAGGYGSNGAQNLLEIEPSMLHQRTPVFLGNRDLVEKAEQYIRLYG